MTRDQLSIRQIGAEEPTAMRELLSVFGKAFEDEAHYTANQPDDAYLSALLARPDFIALVALDRDAVVGGLTAYELHKYEQAVSELYLYDLAVATTHQRQGIATCLIESLQQISARRGNSIVFVQADREDNHAIALYAKQGEKTEVVHFEFNPLPQRRR